MLGPSRWLQRLPRALCLPGIRPARLRSLNKLPPIPTKRSPPCRTSSTRARTRLELKIPDKSEPARPYYSIRNTAILDLDVRTIVAEFGALVSSTTGKNRIMSVDVRVGDYNLDSSNFITDEGFSGFLGSTGHDRHRRRLRFAAPGLVAGHRSGVQSCRRESFQEAGVHVPSGEGPEYP